MSFRKLVPTLFFLIFLSSALYSQTRMRIGFYNLENFFDVFHDSLRAYNEFTPEGPQHWDYDRFLTKRNHIFKVLVAMGQGDAPDLMGFCEVENEIVLRELIYKTPLKIFDFQYIYYPTPDVRGIGTAVIYRKQHLTLLASRPVPVRDASDTIFRTRDILHAVFLSGDDTLHVFVNHWPSRFSGTLATNGKRMLAASVLKHQTDSLLRRNQGSKLIIMGDFNDCAEDDSMLIGLSALVSDTVRSANCIVNLFNKRARLGFEGSLKHEHRWQIFDQILVSGNMLIDTSGLHYEDQSARIFAPSFLLESDKRYSGQKTYRTYLGPRYIGGFSDHLPVYIDVINR